MNELARKPMLIDVVGSVLEASMLLLRCFHDKKNPQKFLEEHFRKA